ncbi:hypothetical protein [Lysobacter solisilvae (ex Woo and Kim 2020)]|uniref:Uncharacterized protein n=1 Tax=Agrilutibacter terrestris TaxID=2865112 RepID=A0A7H0FU94_9GAMM|nr:hypothetical protein [Lysobacter terrestris]QNP39610.1 hypothetical protein H8B22_08705 [Lysobacter terrestris]
MNTHHDDPHDFPDALRWQLRALRQDATPAHDLWPGIAGRLAPQRASAPAARRWLRPATLAMAASLVLAVGAAGWLARTGQYASPPAPTLVQREADSLSRQYQAALQEVQAPIPASLQPTAEALDRDVATIRAALASDPDSVRLLEQLRRTYAHRLALAQRVAYT